MSTKLKRKNIHLQRARTSINDEFYTQLIDIENELNECGDYFRDKTVYCNCDAVHSNFFRYFHDNFKLLGIKKLIISSYVGDLSTATYTTYDGTTITTTPIDGDGDFRSVSCVALLDQVDVVVTNPPFSMFRDFIDTMVSSGKQFIIIGSLNVVTNKQIFAMIRGGYMWFGVHTPHYFILPDGTTSQNFGNIHWFTNVNYVNKPPITLSRTYGDGGYIKYHNYDAIEVGRVSNIPNDYGGVMGVPISFLPQWNIEQFDVVGLTNGLCVDGIGPTLRYDTKTLTIVGDTDNVRTSSINCRSTILHKIQPKKRCYTTPNVDGFITSVYARVLIMNKTIPKQVVSDNIFYDF